MLRRFLSLGGDSSQPRQINSNTRRQYTSELTTRFTQSTESTPHSNSNQLFNRRKGSE
jgi:hypothetical protein